MANLNQLANKNWANRPDDEAYWTVEELLVACKAEKEASRVAKAKTDDVHVISTPHSPRK